MFAARSRQHSPAKRMTSLIVFHDGAMRARDSVVEMWFALIVQELNKINSPPLWAIEMKNAWLDQIGLSLNGCVGPELQKYLDREERVELVISLSDEALVWLSRQGLFFDTEQFNYLLISVRAGLGDRFSGQVLTEHVRGYGQTFIKMLRKEFSGCWPPENKTVN